LLFPGTFVIAYLLDSTNGRIWPAGAFLDYRPHQSAYLA
jgi:hypothetical protein